MIFYFKKLSEYNFVGEKMKPENYKKIFVDVKIML